MKTAQVTIFIKENGNTSIEVNGLNDFKKVEQILSILTSAENTKIYPKTNRKCYQWTKDENELLIKLLHLPVERILNAPGLSRHTKASVRTRLSAIKHSKLNKFSANEIIPLLLKNGFVKLAAKTREAANPIKLKVSDEEKKEVEEVAAIDTIPTWFKKN